MTLAAKFPCLRFLSPTPRKDTSSSISESSYRDSVISRQSTASRTHFITACPDTVNFFFSFSSRLGCHWSKWSTGILYLNCHLFSCFTLLLSCIVRPACEEIGISIICLQSFPLLTLWIIFFMHPRWIPLENVLQVFKNVGMEPLGRKSGDSFRSIPSYRGSSRGRSYKKRIEQKSQAPEKVRNTTHRTGELNFHGIFLGLLRKLFFPHLPSTHPPLVNHLAPASMNWFPALSPSPLSPYWFLQGNAATAWPVTFQMLGRRKAASAIPTRATLLIRWIIEKSHPPTAGHPRVSRA